MPSVIRGTSGTIGGIASHSQGADPFGGHLCWKQRAPLGASLCAGEDGAAPEVARSGAS